MSDAFWQAIGPVLVAIVGGPLVLLVSRSDKKPADTPPDAPATAEREHVEQAHGISTDGIDDRLLKMICRQDDRMDAIERDNAALHADLARARWDLGAIWSWIKAGMPDPPGPGEMPDYIDLTKHQ